MNATEVVFKEIASQVARHHHLVAIHVQTGTLTVSRGKKRILVRLPEALLSQYLKQLTEDELPETLPHAEDERDTIRARYIALWIRELLDSDLRSSLLSIELEQTGEGTIALATRRGPDLHAFVDSLEPGAYHWVFKQD